MSKAKLVITAVTVQGISQAEAVRRYGVSKAWVSKLMARWRAEGEAAFEPRTRRPHHSPRSVAEPAVAAVLLAIRFHPHRAGRWYRCRGHHLAR